MNIVLTGFEPFNGLQQNPTQAIVEAIARQAESDPSGDRLITAILPVEFQAAATQICQLIQTHQPDVVISLGVAVGRTGIQLEELAQNWDEATIPDNAGEQRPGQEIRANAPKTYPSTLPLWHFHHVLQAHQIPVAFSQSAGHYVCNHVFYVAQHYSHTLAQPPLCGFIHVPAMTEQVTELRPETPHLSLATLVQAIQLCLATLKTGQLTASN